MRKIISVLMVALLASSLSLTAQNRGNAAPAGEGQKMGMPRMDMMKELNLTDEQKAKLKEMRQQFAAKDSTTKGPFGRGNGQQGMRQGRGRMMGQAPMGQGRAQMMAQGRGQMMNKRAQMLNGRGMQYGRMNNRMPMSKKDAKAFQKHAKRMNKAPMVNPEVRIKNQVERMTKQLDLTPEQASQINDIQMKHFKKDIAKYQKAQKKRDAAFKKRHGNLDEIKAVLTPEQVQKMEQLKEKAPNMQMGRRPMNGPRMGGNM